MKLIQAFMRTIVIDELALLGDERHSYLERFDKARYCATYLVVKTSLQYSCAENAQGEIQ